MRSDARTAAAIESVMDARDLAARGPVFYQLYYMGGRDASAAIIERVRRAGVAGVVLTVDTASTSPRDGLHSAQVMVPTSLRPAQLLRFAPEALARPRWLLDQLRGGPHEPRAAMALRPDGSPAALFEGLAQLYQQTPDWADIPWIRERWSGPLVVKGVLRADDARRAVAAGADAVVVSNHGGNELDGAVASLRALPEVVEAVGDEIEVLMDSGVRRGTDVVKALGLGARAVLLGHAYVYPLLVAGEPGVRRILELFHRQIDTALAFLGVPSVHDLHPSLLDVPQNWPARLAAGRPPGT